MTRKQALHKALEALTDKDAKSKIQEILGDMPFTGWGEKTIFDTLDQFVIDYGRMPNTSDFKKKGLPPHTVIRLRFGINLKEFLQKYYPPEMMCASRLYYEKSEEEWMDLFIQDYIRNKPSSAEKYNKTRKQGTPSWQTISAMFGIRKWSEWLKHCGIERPCRTNFKPRIAQVSLTLRSHNELLANLERSDH